MVCGVAGPWFVGGHRASLTKDDNRVDAELVW